MDKQRFQNLTEGAILGFVVGDALGVPAEFLKREELAADPVVGMRSGGAHGQRAGTWSDDSSMTLCAMDSLMEKGIDYTDLMQRFSSWLWNGSNTAHNEVFDVEPLKLQSSDSTKRHLLWNAGRSRTTAAAMDPLCASSPSRCISSGSTETPTWTIALRSSSTIPPSVPMPIFAVRWPAVSTAV